jgi:hypothetical protein
MSQRDARWLRRRTTLRDLLDDGIENGSDLKSQDPYQPVTPPDPAIRALRDETIAAIRREAQRGRARRVGVSGLGLLLGSVLIASGTLLLLFPVDMAVHHARIRYLPSFIEHVDHARSRLYGVSLLLGGIGLGVFAAYRPRRGGA